MTQGLERRELLLVCRVRRCKDGEVALDRAHYALSGHGARIVIEVCRVAREVDEVLGLHAAAADRPSCRTREKS